MTVIPTAAAGAGAAAAMAQAIKASGAIVQVEPEQFMNLLSKMDSPLVVTAKGGFLRTTYKYLTGYKGLVFFTRSPIPLELKMSIEVLEAKRIWIPD